MSMKLLIAVPTLDTVPVDFLESLSKLIIRLKDDGVDFALKIEAGTLVYFARESLARYAIANRFSHVLWLDSDMVFTDGIADDLQFCGKKIVTGIAHSRRPPYSSCLFTQIFPGVEKWKGNEYPSAPFRVAACGMAACLVAVEVLEAVREKFGNCFQPMTEPITYGEDVAFCWRATQCGYEIWADPAVRVGHVARTVIYPEDWRESP